jgi:dihydrofolate synthase/folylpolyglutamate synthase
MTYAQAIEFLYGLRPFGARFGLETTLRLAALAGNPQDRLRFIHVAGTNGKGSTCAMLEGIYRAAGLRVGLFTSPHLVNFAERLQVNRRFISETEVVRLVDEIQPLLQEFPEDHQPTFFEATTLMALRHFAEQHCDLVIWETGLGGRLDATNIVTPLASIITNIGIEHSEWLGDTFDKIAAEKAGIIKPGIPVVTAARRGEGLEVIRSVARDQQAPLIVVDAAEAEAGLIRTIELPLHGPHQRLNAATALATVRVLGDRIAVGDSDTRRGLATVFWPGRMQRVRTASGQSVLLDGAHNPAGAEALRVALQAEFPGSQPTVIFGVFRDKDSASMCHSLAPLAHRILLAPVQSERSEDPARLALPCREVNPQATIEVCGSLEHALQGAASDPFIVVAGSLYLVGEAMELLHLATAPSSDERRLNEWVVGKATR